MMRGFSTILPVLVMGSVLMSAAALASQDAYAVRLSVLHAERIAEADAAAGSCASSVLLRLVQEPEAVIPPEEVTLGNRVLCAIDRVEARGSRYEIYTSAKSADAVVHWRTDAHLEHGQIVRAVSRKI